MIKVTVSKNSNGVYNRVCLQGHAMYAESGFDIICSAVSVLFINTVNSIEQFTDDPFCIEQDEKKARNELVLTGAISSESELLMKSFILGLQGVQDEYGKKYIRILFE